MARHLILSSGSGVISIAVPDAAPSPGAYTPQILPTYVAAATARCAANTAEWQKLKARLDANLPPTATIPTYTYECTWMFDLPPSYALAYRAIKDSGGDMATANKYAGYAIASVLAIFRGYASGDGWSKALLGVGDGSNKVFTLPDAVVQSSTIRVFKAPILTWTITKGAAGSQDTLPYGNVVITRVYQGGTTYAKSTCTGRYPSLSWSAGEWRQNPDLPNWTIDWSGASSQPAQGTTYSIEYVWYAGYSLPSWEPTFVAAPGGFTFNSGTNQVTLSTYTPTASEAVFADYVYDSPGGLPMQMSSDNLGGFNNLSYDQNYALRSLGLYPAMIFDWCYDFAPLATAADEIMSMLVRMAHFGNADAANRPYLFDNYGISSFTAPLMAGLALENRYTDDPDALADETATARSRWLACMNNDFTDPPDALRNSGTAKGGLVADGWWYGGLATTTLAITELALQDAGATLAPERATMGQFAGDVVAAMRHSCYSWGVTEAGYGSLQYDGYIYPAGYNSFWNWMPWCGPTGLKMFYPLSAMASDANRKAHANWFVKNSLTQGDYVDNWNYSCLLFFDGTAASADMTATEPPHFFVAGQGTLLARSDWANHTWLSYSCGLMYLGSHMTFTCGELEINRGVDVLLMDANVQNSVPTVTRALLANCVNVDDNGEGGMYNAWSQYNWPIAQQGGVGITAKELADPYCYAAGKYAYSYNKQGVVTTPANDLTRAVLYVRPDYVIVFDRVRMKNSGVSPFSPYPHRIQWHTNVTPTVVGNTFSWTVGASKLFGATYSGAAMTTGADAAVQASPLVNRVRTTTTAATVSVNYTTVLQPAPSATSSMDASARLVSGDSQVEGVLVGSTAALFGAEPPLSFPISYSFTAPAGTITHYLCDCAPGHAYTLSGSASGTATAGVGGVLTYTTTGGDGSTPQSVTITY